MTMRYLAIVAALYPCLAFSTAAGADELPFSGQTGCGQNMSCMPLYPAMSRMADAGPNYSPVPVSAAAAENPCAGGARSMVNGRDIPACETWIAAGHGTARQRAEDLFHLGHGYSFTNFKPRDGMPEGYRLAIETWDRAISIDPGYIDPYVSKGFLLAMGSEPLDALPVLDEAIRIAPDHWWPRAIKAKALNAAHKNGAAIEEARRAAELAPDNHLAVQILGEMLKDGRNYGEAAEWYRKAVMLFGKNRVRFPGFIQESNPWTALAQVYARARRWRDAESTLTQYIDSLPAMSFSPDLYLDRAEYREAMGAYGGAADDLEQAARAMGQVQDVRNFRMRRATLLVRAGRMAEAESEFDGLMMDAKPQLVLQMQVFLKNAGFDDIEVNGKFDELTQRALRSCLRETACSETVGQRM